MPIMLIMLMSLPAIVPLRLKVTVYKSTGEAYQVGENNVLCFLLSERQQDKKNRNLFAHNHHEMKGKM